MKFLSPPVLFYTGKVVYVCFDYKSLPRHRGFWEKLESERERERDLAVALNEILFSGGTQLGNIKTH